MKASGRALNRMCVDEGKRSCGYRSSGRRGRGPALLLCYGSEQRWAGASVVGSCGGHVRHAGMACASSRLLFAGFAATVSHHAVPESLRSCPLCRRSGECGDTAASCWYSTSEFKAAKQPSLDRMIRVRCSSRVAYCFAWSNISKQQ